MKIFRLVRCIHSKALDRHFRTHGNQMRKLMLVTVMVLIAATMAQSGMVIRRVVPEGRLSQIERRQCAPRFWRRAPDCLSAVCDCLCLSAMPSVRASVREGSRELGYAQFANLGR